MKTEFFIALMLLSMALVLPSTAAIVHIDEINDSFYISSSQTFTGIDAIGGERRIEINGGYTGTASISGFSQFYIHSLAVGSWSSIYGYSSDLNADLSEAYRWGTSERVITMLARADVPAASPSLTLQIESHIGEGSYSSYSSALTIPSNTDPFKYSTIEFDLDEYVSIGGIDLTDVDRITFSLTNIPGDGDVFIGGIDAGTAPEPASMALLGIGAALLMLRRRIQKGFDRSVSMILDPCPATIEIPQKPCQLGDRQIRKMWYIYS